MTQSKHIRTIAAMTAIASWLLGALPAHALFDDIAPSPRARALGEAMTSIVDDAWAYYYNPGMLPRLPGLNGAVTTVQPSGLSFMRMTTLAVASQLPGRAGGVSFGWRYFGVENGSTTLSRENTLSVSHGFMLFGDASTSASVGWTLNFFHAEFAPSVTGIDPGSAWSYGFDIGGAVTVYDRTTVGFFARNINNPTIGDDAEELEQQAALGISYQPYPGVTTAIDVRDGLRTKLRIHGGLEFEIVPRLQLRFGIETEPSKLTGGFGLHLPKVSIDYGFSTGGGVLDASHHFGLSTRLDIYGEASP
jgi:hypothetical protein